ncbi:hypothetical protein [Streptomyces sp. bgisy027]|uniref:hypothetical protein n=1 Tax=unclassified Streptomyces TaxID=2593676 RepID=UPI003D746786
MGDFDLVDNDGDCLLAAQVKSASPGRRVSAPDAFTILAELVSKVEAERYELITAALPDRICRALATILNAPPADPRQHGWRSCCSGPPRPQPACRPCPSRTWNALPAPGS